MKNRKHLSNVRKKCVALFTAGVLFAWPLGSCNLGQVDVSSSITISARDVLTGIIISAIVDPLEQAVVTGINEVFDELED